MRLKLPLPRHWPIVDQGPPVVVEVLPGVQLTLGELETLPADLRAWGDRIVFAGHAAEDVRVGQVQDATTVTGWPVTVFGSDLLDPRTKAVVERRMHAVYRFEKRGGAAILRGADLHMFEQATAEVLAVMLQGGPDYRSDEIVGLAELWSGLELESKGDRPSTGPKPSLY